MPLEDQLSAIGNALNRIANAIERGALPQTSATASPKVETTTVEVPVPAPKATKPKAKTPEVAPEVTPEVAAPAAPAEPAPAPAADKPATLADLRDAAQALLQAGRLPDIIAINKQHGIRKITEASEDKYPAILASLKEALANVPAK
jgi:hypothetical protein